MGSHTHLYGPVKNIYMDQSIFLYGPVKHICVVSVKNDAHVSDHICMEHSIYLYLLYHFVFLLYPFCISIVSSWFVSFPGCLLVVS